MSHLIHCRCRCFDPSDDPTQELRDEIESLKEQYWEAESKIRVAIDWLDSKDCTDLTRVQRIYGSKQELLDILSCSPSKRVVGG